MGASPFHLDFLWPGGCDIVGTKSISKGEGEWEWEWAGQREWKGEWN